MITHCKAPEIVSQEKGELAASSRPETTNDPMHATAVDAEAPRIIEGRNLLETNGVVGTEESAMELILTQHATAAINHRAIDPVNGCDELIT